MLVRNWHALDWETEEQIAKRRSVDKRGAKSDEAYVREVLGEMAGARNILVINDEAHHAWRVPAESKVKGVSKADIEEATKWIGGLDRIHRARGILACYDFSATPFVPSGKQSSEEALFEWIVSDFGLNDAIESGLVKTPRVVVRDDGQLDSRLQVAAVPHLQRPGSQGRPEPQGRGAGAAARPGDQWLLPAGQGLAGNGEEVGRPPAHKTPPVMITVANRTETAARVKYAFDRGKIRIDELRAPERTLHIDSKVLEKAEAARGARQRSTAEPTATNDEDESDEAPACES